MVFSSFGLLRTLVAQQTHNLKHIFKLGAAKYSVSHDVRPQIVMHSTKQFLTSQRTICQSQRLFSSPVIASSDSDDTVSPTELYDKATELQEVTKGDPELEKKLRILCLEHEVLRQEGIRVPRSLNPDQWRQLLDLDSRSKRKKYYKFLFGIEIKKDKEKHRKQQKAQERLERQETAAPIEEENGHIKYGLGHNSIMLRVYDTTINNTYNNNLIRAMQFSQKLVIDCGYDNHMTSQESSNCAKQLMLAFSENRMHDDPFDIHLCNAHKDSSTIRQLNKFIPNLYEDYFPLNVSEQSYLDHFDRQDIVYLTPHCRTELVKFDHEAVYVVGAIVDKHNSEPLSLAKAKREGLRMAKLPLDRYLQWSGGSGKSLTINQMLQILLEARLSGDWERALAHVPRRKIVPDEPYTSQPRSSQEYSFSWSNRRDKKPAMWGDRPQNFPSRDQNWRSKGRKYSQ